MKLAGSIVAMAAYFLVAASAPIPTLLATPTATPASTGLATVDVRIVGPHNAHYSTPNQSPTSDQSQHLTVIVGQTLALDRDPLHIQGLQVVAVKGGESLSLLPTTVVEDDWRVVCTARVSGREDLLEFDLKDGGVLLAGGRLVKVTRLSCTVDEEAVISM